MNLKPSKMTKKELIQYNKDKNKKINESIKNNFDRVSIALPKGTKERILASGKSINGLINELVLDYLAAADQEKEK